jgi:hypothetical protein
MANSITPAGTSRTLFGIATGDIITGGSITASSFLGVGKDITFINANNITSGNIGVSRGGTGNNSFINNALVFNSNNQLISDNNLSWRANVLRINNRDFLSDTSNYVRITSNKLSTIIYSSTDTLAQSITSNISQTNLNTSNYVLSTSNTLIHLIKTEQANNVIFPATTTTLGGVQIGDGLYINDKGVISVMPEIVNTVFPTINNTSLTFTQVPNSDYKVCKFVYNSSIGTTFDRNNAGSLILPIWYKFTNDNKVVNNGITIIKNSGYQGYLANSLTRLELHGDITIKPSIEEINMEFTPLDTTYIELNCITETPTFCKFERNFDINSIFKAFNYWAMTIGFWLKINSFSDEIIILEFSNDNSGNLRKLNINYANNTLKFFIDKDKEPVITIPQIYRAVWYHILWSIERLDNISNMFEVIVSINGVKKETLAITNSYLYILGFNNYIKNTISSTANTSNYNFCVSDFKIYNYALQDDEKMEIYNANYYTKYLIDFKDTATICDIMAYGGGGGGSSNYGGGAGKLVYANDAYIASGLKTIKIGRGGCGYYSNMSNYHVALKGTETTFENLIADGGGAISNYLFDYKFSNIFVYTCNYSYYSPVRLTMIPATFTSNILTIVTKTSNNIIHIDGGSGSGDFGSITNFNITSSLRTFLGDTSNIYSYGFIGGEYGGGGTGSSGVSIAGGAGLYGLNINNINIDTDKYFNFKNTINFKNDFNLVNNEIGELNGGNVYIASGGAGMSLGDNEKGIPGIGYNSANSGSGGNTGEKGKNGALLLRVLAKIDKKVLPKFIGETSNYVTTSSNNIIDFVKTLANESGSLLWTRATSNVYFNSGNVGIGIEPNNYKFEVASGTGITGDTLNDLAITYGFHTSNDPNIIVATNIVNSNICAKFNSSIWTSGNVISSSDERIKKNIRDLQDDSALQMILNIQPKKYNYIDLQTKGSSAGTEIYGFIAQQIKEVIPDAVKIQTEFIPNIFSVADYNIAENIITLPSRLQSGGSLNIAKATRIKCYDMRDNMIIVEVIEVIEVIEILNIISIKIKNIKYYNDKIFVYGTEVNDFHALNKEYINTLNVCAVQELHRKIITQQEEITGLNEKINVLINYVDLSKIMTLQDEINDLRSRFDVLLNYIDLSK